MELLGRFSDRNICERRIRLAHHVKGHFENTEKTFLVSVKALERKENEEIRNRPCHFLKIDGLGLAQKPVWSYISRFSAGAVYRQAGPEDLEAFCVMHLITKS